MVGRWADSGSGGYEVTSTIGSRTELLVSSDGENFGHFRVVSGARVLGRNQSPLNYRGA